MCCSESTKDVPKVVAIESNQTMEYDANDIQRVEYNADNTKRNKFAIYKEGCGQEYRYEEQDSGLLGDDSYVDDQDSRTTAEESSVNVTKESHDAELGLKMVESMAHRDTLQLLEKRMEKEKEMIESMAKFEQQISQLQSERDSAQSERDSAQLELEKERVALYSLMAELAEAKEDIAKEKQKAAETSFDHGVIVATMEERIASLEADKDAVRRELANEHKVSKEADDFMFSLMTENDALSLTKEDMKKNLTRLELAKEEMKKHIASHEAERQDMAAKLESENNRLKSNMEELKKCRAELENVTGEKEKLESDLANTQAQLKEITIDKEELKSDLIDVTAQLKEAKVEMEASEMASEKKITTLKKEKEEMASRLVELAMELTTAKNDAEKEKQSFSNRDASRAEEVRGLIEKLEGEKKKSLESTRDLSSIIGKLEQRISDTESKMENDLQEFSEREKNDKVEIKRIQGQLDKSRSETSQSKTMYEGLQRKYVETVKDYESKLQNANDATKSVEIEQMHFREQIVVLEHEEEARQAENAGLKAKIKLLEKEKSQLMGNVQSLEGKLLEACKKKEFDLHSPSTWMSAMEAPRQF